MMCLLLKSEPSKSHSHGTSDLGSYAYHINHFVYKCLCYHLSVGKSPPPPFTGEGYQLMHVAPMYFH